MDGRYLLDCPSRIRMVCICLYDSGGVVFDHTAEMLRNIQKLRFIIIGDDIDAELVPMGFL